MIERFKRLFARDDDILRIRHEHAIRALREMGVTK